jgi:hypothetical protein
MGSLRKHARVLAPAAIAIAALTVGGFGFSAATASTAAFGVTGVSLSGTTAAPVVTVTGQGFGTEPTRGVAPSSVHSCAHTGTGLDYRHGALWFVDSTAGITSWSAGAASITGHPNCIGINITSWSDTQVVFSFGSQYGAPVYVLHDGDGFVISLKTHPIWGVVPQGF